ncbi:MAG: hypothetical protein AAGA48_12060 [Myxococcota bacterium]
MWGIVGWSLAWAQPATVLEPPAPVLSDVEATTVPEAPETDLEQRAFYEAAALLPAVARIPREPIPGAVDEPFPLYRPVTDWAEWESAPRVVVLRSGWVAHAPEVMDGLGYDSEPIRRELAKRERQRRWMVRLTGLSLLGTVAAATVPERGRRRPWVVGSLALAGTSLLTAVVIQGQVDRLNDLEWHFERKALWDDLQTYNQRLEEGLAAAAQQTEAERAAAEFRATYRAARVTLHEADVTRGWYATVGLQLHAPELTHLAHPSDQRGVDHLIARHGGRWIDTPTLLETLGEDPSQLERRIRRKRNTGQVFVGLGTMVAFVPLARRSIAPQRPGAVTAASIAASAVSFYSATRLFRSSRRARWDLDATWSRERTIERVEAYNAELLGDLERREVATNP